MQALADAAVAMFDGAPAAAPASSSIGAKDGTALDGAGWPVFCSHPMAPARVSSRGPCLPGAGGRPHTHARFRPTPASFPVEGCPRCRPPGRPASLPFGGMRLRSAEETDVLYGTTLVGAPRARLLDAMHLNICKRQCDTAVSLLWVLMYDGGGKNHLRTRQVAGFLARSAAECVGASDPALVYECIRLAAYTCGVKARSDGGREVHPDWLPARPAPQPRWKSPADRDWRSVGLARSHRGFASSLAANGQGGHTAAPASSSPAADDAGVPSHQRAGASFRANIFLYMATLVRRLCRARRDYRCLLYRASPAPPAGGDPAFGGAADGEDMKTASGHISQMNAAVIGRNAPLACEHAARAVSTSGASHRTILQNLRVAVSARAGAWDGEAACAWTEHLLLVIDAVHRMSLMYPSEASGSTPLGPECVCDTATMPLWIYAIVLCCLERPPADAADPAFYRHGRDALSHPFSYIESEAAECWRGSLPPFSCALAARAAECGDGGGTREYIRQYFLAGGAVDVADILPDMSSTGCAGEREGGDILLGRLVSCVRDLRCAVSDGEDS